MKRLVLFIISGFAFYLASGQELKRFSEDPGEFIVEFETFMKKNITQENEEILKNYIDIWNQDTLGFMSADEKKKLIEISNTLLGNSARAYPHFRDFLLSVMSFRRKETRPDEYHAWQE